MKELEMIKAFAELESVEVELIDPDFDSMFYATLGKNKRIEEYNPITDHSLTFKAMVKYDVCVNGLDITVHQTDGDFQADNLDFLSVPDENLISYSIIECILKSEGKWNES